MKVEALYIESEVSWLLSPEQKKNTSYKPHHAISRISMKIRKNNI